MSFSYFVWGVNLALLGLILYRGFGNRMLGHFPIFYAYVSYVFIVTAVLAAITAIYKFDSVEYVYAFHAQNSLLPLLQFWVLLDLYRRIVGNTKTSRAEFLRSGIVVAVATAPVVWKVLVGDHGFFLRYHAIAIVLQVFLCLIIYRALGKNSGIILGQNFIGILSGVSLMVALQAINFSSLLFLGSPQPNVFRFFTQFFYFLALIVFTYALWEEKPIHHRRTRKSWMKSTPDCSRY